MRAERPGKILTCAESLAPGYECEETSQAQLVLDAPLSVRPSGLLYWSLGLGSQGIYFYPFSSSIVCEPVSRGEEHILVFI